MPALALPPAPPACSSFDVHGAMDMDMLSRTARAEPEFADWQQVTDPIHEPDAADQGQPH